VCVCVYVCVCVCVCAESFVPAHDVITSQGHCACKSGGPAAQELVGVLAPTRMLLCFVNGSADEGTRVWCLTEVFLQWL